MTATTLTHDSVTAAAGPADGPAELTPTSPEFLAAAAMRMGVEARRVGWTIPQFTSPPANPTVNRSLARAGDGSVRVAVRLEGRTAGEVLDDMADGVVAANADRPPRVGYTPAEMWLELWRAGAGL